MSRSQVGRKRVRELSENSISVVPHPCATVKGLKGVELRSKPRQSTKPDETNDKLSEHTTASRVSRKAAQVIQSVKLEKEPNIKSESIAPLNNHITSSTIVTSTSTKVEVKEDDDIIKEASSKSLAPKNLRILSSASKMEDVKSDSDSKLVVVAPKSRATRGRAKISAPIITEVGEEVAVTVDIKLSSSRGGSKLIARKRQKMNTNEEVVNGRQSTEGTIVRDRKEIKSVLYSENYAACGKYLGAHTSIAGSLCNAIQETIDMGGRAFAMFLKSSRTWKSKPLEDADADKFKLKLQDSGIEPRMVVPHGSYLLNCGASNEEVLSKSRDCLVDELLRCEKLGLPIYNFHPGSSTGTITTSECIARIVESINYAHSKTQSVITVIENMSCQGHTVGGKFSELRQMIDGVTNKTRVGICLDTCHAFAAGYDIHSESGYEKMKAEFVSVIGRQYLKAVHLNDSKGDLGCHLDRHENIGKGKIGLEAFGRIMNDPFFSDIPMILETPEGDYGKEIQTLYGLCKFEL